VDRYRFASGTAVVTGAGSGIGAALAAGLAERGSDLVLIDRHEERLTRVATSLRSAHPARTVDTVLADLGDIAAVRLLGVDLADRFPATTLLVNNAGIALTGRFDQVTLDEFDRVLDVNLRAAVALTHGLLPVLRRTPGSHLVNVSSIFGIIAPPGQAAYATSKFALRGFTEVLRAELHPEVGVTSVHPGGIATRIAEDAQRGSAVSAGEADAERRLARRLLTIPPERAAEAILKGVERRRPRVLIGASAVLPDLVQRAAPTLIGRVLADRDAARRSEAPRPAAARDVRRGA
jgi:short-subunit dehydrogenase